MNKVERENVLQAIEQTSNQYIYFVVLFRGNLGRQDYKALYGHDGVEMTLEKVHGPSNVPDVLEHHLLEKFYRYDSGNKVFKELSGIKSLTLTTDAFTMKQQKKSQLPSNLY